MAKACGSGAYWPGQTAISLFHQPAQWTKVEGFIATFHRACAAQYGIVFGFEAVESQDLPKLLQQVERVKANTIFFVIFCHGRVDPTQLPQKKNVFFVCGSPLSINGRQCKTKSEEFWEGVEKKGWEWAYKPMCDPHKSMTLIKASLKEVKRLAAPYKMEVYLLAGAVYVLERQDDAVKSVLELLKERFGPGETLLMDFGDVERGLAWGEVMSCRRGELPDMVQALGLVTYLSGLSEAGQKRKQKRKRGAWSWQSKLSTM